MNRAETEILKQIENGLLQDDAAFVQRMTGSPRISTWHKVRFAALAYVGIIVVMMYQINLGLAVAGYAVILAASIDLLQRRTSVAAPMRGALDRNGSSRLEPSFD